MVAIIFYNVSAYIIRSAVKQNQIQYLIIVKIDRAELNSSRQLGKSLLLFKDYVSRATTYF